MGNSKFKYEGVRDIDFNLDSDAIEVLKHSWMTQLETFIDYPSSKFTGKGIVICAGGIEYFTCAWVSIKYLRDLGCNLNIEVWHQEWELTEDIIQKLTSLGVRCCNFKFYNPENLIGYALKPLAILNSSFEEVLFLDSDNICVKDPTYLFNSPGYVKNGAVFWPDFWLTSRENPIWKIVDNYDYDLPEIDSGQLLINKKTCWRELNLCVYFNEQNSTYYRLLHGDKDTFKFAWAALGKSFHLISENVGCLGFLTKSGEFRGITMAQHDENLDVIFLHRNLLKWHQTSTLSSRRWLILKKFKQNAKEKGIYIGFKTEERHIYMRLDGDVVTSVFEGDDKDTIEVTCLLYLEELRTSAFYLEFANDYQKLILN